MLFSEDLSGLNERYSTGGDFHRSVHSQRLIDNRCISGKVGSEWVSIQPPCFKVTLVPLVQFIQSILLNSSWDLAEMRLQPKPQPYSIFFFCFACFPPCTSERQLLIKDIYHYPCFRTAPPRRIWHLNSHVVYKMYLNAFVIWHFAFLVWCFWIFIIDNIWDLSLYLLTVTDFSILNYSSRGLFIVPKGY